MPLTPQEKQAKWPWRHERDDVTGALYINRSNAQFDVEDHGDYLGTFTGKCKEAAAIWAIAKTQE